MIDSKQVLTALHKRAALLHDNLPERRGSGRLFLKRP